MILEIIATPLVIVSCLAPPSYPKIARNNMLIFPSSIEVEYQADTTNFLWFQWLLVDMCAI